MRIELRSGGKAEIDDADAALVGQFAWYLTKRRHCYYARRNVRLPDKRVSTQYMHRLILGVGLGITVDHIDHDGLNNRRANLRPATTPQQGANSLPRGGKSRFKGVTWTTRHARPGHRYWIAQIGTKGQHKGKHCSSELEAAATYNEWARERYGPFALLNDLDRVRESLRGIE